MVGQPAGRLGQVTQTRPDWRGQSAAPARFNNYTDRRLLAATLNRYSTASDSVTGRLSVCLSVRPPLGATRGSLETPSRLRQGVRIA